MLLSTKTKRSKKFETFLRYLSEEIKNGKAGYAPERIYLQLAIDMNMVLGDAKSPEYDKVMKMIKSASHPHGNLWPTSRLVFQLNNNSISASRNPATVALRNAFAVVCDSAFEERRELNSTKRNRTYRNIEESMLNLYEHANSLGVRMEDHLSAIKISITYETDVEFIGVDPRR